ncbi:MAG TPA: hypothetical protein PLN12_15040 [Flavobacteriales bacterium]|nr:hypothetical protein [Flavobacteriales bacterium]
MNKQIQNLRHLACEILKEIDAIEVKEESKWTPKVGDRVRYIDDTGVTTLGHGVVTNLHKGALTGRVSASVQFETTNDDFWAEDLRPATPKEIAEHEAKIEAAKPIRFGTRVEFEYSNRTHQGRVAYDTADVDGYYLIAFINEDMLNDCAHRSRDEFKVID